MAGDDWVEDVGSTTCAFGVRGGEVRRGDAQSAPRWGMGTLDILGSNFS